jgi:hypothetical protein
MVGVGGMALPRPGSAEEEALLKAGLCTALAMSALDALARGLEGVQENTQTRRREPNWVVRAGVATAQQLQGGTDFHRHVPGLYGFSVQREAGKTIQELAAAGQFPNGQISVATVEALVAAAASEGYIVAVVKSPGNGFHHTVAVPLNPQLQAYPAQKMPPELAEALSNVFVPQPNPARVPRR